MRTKQAEAVSAIGPANILLSKALALAGSISSWARAAPGARSEAERVAARGRAVRIFIGGLEMRFRALVAARAEAVQRLRLIRSAQRRVDLLQRRRAGAERVGFERIERRLHRVEVGMQIFRLRIDIEQAGDDLALGRVLLQEGHG